MNRLAFVFVTALLLINSLKVLDNKLSSPQFMKTSV